MAQENQSGLINKNKSFFVHNLILINNQLTLKTLLVPIQR